MGSLTGEERGGRRYQVGWRSREQDKANLTRVARVKEQNYNALKRDCQDRGVLFEDKEFPAIETSVYYSYNTGYNFEWKRPHEITSDPHMFVGGMTRFDVKQGDLGNCWFLAAVASLCASKNKELVKKVVPADNSFSQNYAGIVHFNIWQYGRWVDVVVDDRLPTVQGRLVFMHSADDNEFWSALLEKAYAKLNGSYEALQGGCTSEAMEDFTGGICETFNFKKEVPANLFTIMKKAHDRGSLLGCTIDATPGQIESVLDNGLVMGHAYSITSVKEFGHRGGTVNLIRVRNPWGNQYEWTGPWSDKSTEWTSLGDAQRNELGISFEDDGEFWMALNDFTNTFTRLEICNLDPTTDEDVIDKSKRKWEVSTEDGSWIPRVNAGGCRNFLDTFWTNPQYRVEVVDPDEDDADNTGTVIVGLLQKERRKKKKEGLDMLTIGYTVYQLQDPSCPPLDLNFFKYNRAIARAPTFSNMREVCGRHKLAPGSYCIIPSTFKAQEEGDFLMRIFSEKPNVTSELDETTRMLDPDESISGSIQITAPAAEPERRRRRAQVQTKEDVVEEKKVRQLFKDNAGPELEVDAYTLRTILDEQFQDMKKRPRFKFDGFSLETCRSLVAMMDIDHSGKLGYQEFKKLWTDLRMWQKIFKEFDMDQNGTFNSYELRQALNAAGFKVSNQTFSCLVMRYSGPQAKIYFDDFVLCAARLKTMFDTYRDTAACKNTADATFTADQFIQTTMYS